MVAGGLPTQLAENQIPPNPVQSVMPMVSLCPECRSRATASPPVPSSSLLHLEVRQVRRAVLEREDQDVAGIRRGWRLPVVDELIAGCIVAQDRAAGGGRFGQRVSGVAGERAAADNRVLQRGERS